MSADDQPVRPEYRCRCDCGCTRAAAGDRCVPCRCGQHRQLDVLCLACEGNGKVPRKRATENGGTGYVPERCATCDGTGRRPFRPPV